MWYFPFSLLRLHPAAEIHLISLLKARVNVWVCKALGEDEKE